MPECDFPWERKAMYGDDLPDGLTVYDQMAYISLRSLYRDYHEKRMDRDAASAEKRMILSAWQKAKRDAEFERKMSFYHARLNRDSEMAKTAVRKNPTPENALMLCNVLDGLEEYRPQQKGGPDLLGSGGQA